MLCAVLHPLPNYPDLPQNKLFATLGKFDIPSQKTKLLPIFGKYALTIIME